MGSFKYIHGNEMSLYKNEDRKKELLQEARNQPIIKRIDGPTKLAKAKSVGYRAKQGYIIVRVRVSKGDFRRPRANHARKDVDREVFFK